MLASAVFLCSLYCLTLWCIVYFLHSAVFFFDCSSSRFEKERAATDACSLAGRRYRDTCSVLTYVCLFECCLYTSLVGTWWKIMMPGWCFSQLQLQGGLSATAALFLCTFHFIIAPEGDAFQTKTGVVLYVVLRLAFYRRVEV